MREVVFERKGGKEVVGSVWWASHIGRTLQAEQEDIDDETVVLEHECRELQATNHAVGIGVVHVLVIKLHVVLAADVVR